LRFDITDAEANTHHFGAELAEPPVPSGSQDYRTTDPPANPSPGTAPSHRGNTAAARHDPRRSQASIWGMGCTCSKVPYPSNHAGSTPIRSGGRSRVSLDLTFLFRVDSILRKEWNTAIGAADRALGGRNGLSQIWIARLAAACAHSLSDNQGLIDTYS
jgi:hypothetical protein